MSSIENDLQDLQSSTSATEPVTAATDDTTKSEAPSETPSEGNGEGELVSPEVVGDTPVPASDGESGSGETTEHDELENPIGTESGEEFVEATEEQLTAEAGADSALSDLQGIDGFEPIEAGDMSESAETDENIELTEVGDALEEEGAEADPEFAFLASLIGPLVSTVGPPLARAVFSKLKPRTRRRIKRRAATPSPQRRVGRRRANRPAKRNQILALLAKLLESAESMPATESSGSVDEVLVNEAAMAIESVIGGDDRVRIGNTTRIPWRQVCALKIRFRNGRMFRGTGFFIGPRVVATAGHCVNLNGEWAESIEVIPGADGSKRPYGSATSRQFRSVSGWVRDRKPSSDYGCVIVPQGSFSGRNLGSMGFAALNSSSLLGRPAVLGGYPGDKPFAELWGMSRRLKSVSANQLHYDIDTMGGQSGSPIYIKRNGQRICCGIHNYGGRTSNTATRITPPVYRLLAKWRNL